jgi:hypothetical protein
MLCCSTAEPLSVLQVQYVRGLDLSPQEVEEARRRYGELVQRDRGAWVHVHVSRAERWLWCCLPVQQTALYEKRCNKALRGNQQGMHYPGLPFEHGKISCTCTPFVLH